MDGEVVDREKDKSEKRKKRALLRRKKMKGKRRRKKCSLDLRREEDNGAIRK